MEWMQHPLRRLVFGVGVLLACGGLGQAGVLLRAAEQSPITETDLTPQSRPLTFSSMLDEYLAMVQQRLKSATRSIQASGLAEVKLTIRKDGAVPFSEIVVLDGPAALRNELLPLVKQLGVLPPPPVDADLLDVSMLLPLGYPGADLLDAIDQDR
jgi:hypothetical protein